MPFPDDVDIIREHNHGLLSWSMVATIKSRKSPLSYGQLERLVSARFAPCAERGHRLPTRRGIEKGGIRIEHMASEI